MFLQEQRDESNRGGVRSLLPDPKGRGGCQAGISPGAAPNPACCVLHTREVWGKGGGSTAAGPYQAHWKKKILSLSRFSLAEVGATTSWESWTPEAAFLMIWNREKLNGIAGG